MDYNLEISHGDEPCKQNILTIDFAHQVITATLSGYSFEDHGFKMLYIPALNLSAYGDTAEEARQMMNELVMPDFLTRLASLSKMAVFEYLSKLGWSAINRESTSFETSAYVDKDGVLRNFDLPADTPIKEDLITV